MLQRPASFVRFVVAVVVVVVAAFGLMACAGPVGHAPKASPPSKPPATMAAAQPGALLQCASLGGFSFASTRITSASVVAAGVLAHAGSPVGEHCLVSGRMHERVSAVDAQTYAIGFEMRLPMQWAGRFLYQGNGGTDGVVAHAEGGFSGGGPLKNGLQHGFAIMSADAGHNASQNPLFGLDPQARLDYGYQAVGSLTPMAKALIAAAYGRPPDRSYIGGTSNGGRHAMVAASRYSASYDGYLAVSPGLHLPRASVANLAGVQHWARVATTTVVNGQPDLESALPKAERQLIAQAILARCDALDGLADGLVNDVEACRGAFDLNRDLPTCSGARDGSCLLPAQKTALALAFGGPRNAKAERIYNSFPFDPGIVQSNWADWKFRNSVNRMRNPVSVGFIFSSPPAAPAMLTNTLGFALGFDVDREAPKIDAASGPYTESAMSFMAPPKATQLDGLRERGAKMIVVHGAADGIFSVDDTSAWYRALDTHHQGQAAHFARLFIVPGMGHSRGGPATDQFDGLQALVVWVEQGQAPDRIVATARSAGNPAGTNTELPTQWAANRTRPLCPYPLVARYQSGDPDVAASFACVR